MAYAVLPAGETKKVRTPDGRDLAYLEFGQPGSPLVIHNHGGPSSRLEGTLLASGAISHGLRLVSVDRPGNGRSSPQKDRTYKGWADDLMTVADALGYQQFGVSGWSEGGPWALAAAAYIDPSRLRHVSYIAGAAYGAFGDNSAAQYLDKVDALGGQLALHHRMAFHLMYELLELDAVHFRKSYIKTLIKMVNERDAKLLEDPTIAEAFADSSAECFAQGSTALVQDAELIYRRWPFDVTKIERSVHMWQGMEDHLVPYRINQEVSQRMPGAVWHPVEGEDHFMPIPASADVFAVAARELGV
ncbi:alpha/beta fold hydrolase [Pseudonocardia charpentierae]|uniref:Alpha/beta hydrolase n=1 Tax=Pseudonocardia charpentierae TaxID=3075545 RepID=A0ABU2NEY7_9PSEU|nr:alpha/beta hydrolase [Pseudonocardia sp. DSM 45834]MDT0352521.1 alpha/beta hydrolase [Pseudonocardia sp. DSM 45834]